MCGLCILSVGVVFAAVDRAPVFSFVFDVHKNGNAPAGADPHGELKGQNTLMIKHSPEEAAAKFKISAKGALVTVLCCSLCGVQRLSRRWRAARRT